MLVAGWYMLRQRWTWLPDIRVSRSHFGEITQTCRSTAEQTPIGATCHQVRGSPAATCLEDVLWHCWACVRIRCIMLLKRARFKAREKTEQLRAEVMPTLAVSAKKFEFAIKISKVVALSLETMPFAHFYQILSCDLRNPFCKHENRQSPPRYSILCIVKQI